MYVNFDDMLRIQTDLLACIYRVNVIEWMFMFVGQFSITQIQVIQIWSFLGLVSLYM